VDGWQKTALLRHDRSVDALKDNRLYMKKSHPLYLKVAVFHLLEDGYRLLPILWLQLWEIYP
jgi:hypothetical protein